ncbi:hypothetical protein [Chryseosolibacter indicus]|uniref:Uncharacterized protein n=1 Tax=Chryseosolibacter indicus TaxID=2782351 RepID=A0ABS5VLS5_9BACT|nr:hypothetical protein [Chryseosolibacter indicus]MBT1702399.1 hypothetical protein [Chryseosolibacter indicus]
MENEKKKTQEELTPIIDGDARPDIDLEAKGADDKESKDQDKKFTSNRASDVNKIENYKDEK